MQELTDVEFEDQSFDDLDLFEADWRNARFVKCRFQGIDLRVSRTDHCLFDTCVFTAARLNLSEHTGSAFVNCSFRMAKLFRARFVECKLTGSHFDQADLGSLVVSGGDWSYVNLRMQDLSGRKFRSLRLVNADLYGCDLRKTDLRDADLSNASLGQAQLGGADLRGATLDGVDLTSFDLRGVRIDLAQAIAVASAHGAIVDAS
jgi:uncharacterized protein YjbI with pentapeptide repeats